MPKPRPLTSFEAPKVLVHRLGRVADRVRGIATRLGARPFRVFLVWQVWNGGDRGEGTVREYRRIEILPTPRIDNIDALANATSIAGTIPTGNLRIQEVSVIEFKQDLLNGYLVNEDEKIPEPYEFFYEVVQDDRHGGHEHRSKFRLTAPPALMANRASWVLLLERISEDRDRSGVDQTGQDRD